MAERHAALRLQKPANPVERIGGDPPAIAQALNQLAVIDRTPAESRFGDAGPAAELCDVLE